MFLLLLKNISQIQDDPPNSEDLNDKSPPGDDSHENYFSADWKKNWKQVLIFIKGIWVAQITHNCFLKFVYNSDETNSLKSKK